MVSFIFWINFYEGCLRNMCNRTNSQLSDNKYISVFSSVWEVWQCKLEIDNSIIHWNIVYFTLHIIDKGAAADQGDQPCSCTDASSILAKLAIGQELFILCIIHTMCYISLHLSLHFISILVCLRRLSAGTILIISSCMSIWYSHSQKLMRK